MVAHIRVGEPTASEATMTDKGRAAKPIRDRLPLRPGDKIERAPEDGSASATPVTAPVVRLKGMLPRPKVPLDLDAIDKASARAVARRRLP